jgi:hypothetical protein
VVSLPRCPTFIPLQTARIRNTYLLSAISVGLSFVIVLVMLGPRRYSASMVLASTCSATISAACHPPPRDDQAYLFPVQWGVVANENGIGHCSLTTARDVSAPVAGDLYA